MPKIIVSVDFEHSMNTIHSQLHSYFQCIQQDNSPMFIFV